MSETESKLTPKQTLFVEAYVGSVRFNATQAARIAGYSDRNAKQQATENLAKPYIRAAIDAILADRCLSEREALDRLTEHANGSMGLFVEQVGSDIQFDLGSERALSNLHLIKRIKTKQKRYDGENSTPPTRDAATYEPKDRF